MKAETRSERSRNNPYALHDKIVATCPRVLIQPDQRIAVLFSILGARLKGIWKTKKVSSEKIETADSLQ